MTVKSISDSLDQEAHSTQFGNNYFSSLVAERKTKPAPPRWLYFNANNMALTVFVEEDRLEQNQFF